MSLNTMINMLQKINGGKIVLIKIGAFYIAKGKDAVLLNKLIKLKNTCLEKQICKVGFPINALNKYGDFYFKYYIRELYGIKLFSI